jgi:pimeloyl-ACP methyl ester carboxylesterase
MAQHIHGPLYYERMGRTGPVIAFIHPNPMDQSCWIFQMAHLSTWYRCIAIDIPGYGRSPKADAGLTMTDMAEACWEAIDDALPGEKAILVGCSVGSSLAPQIPPASRQNRGTRVVGHRLQPQQGIYQRAHR